MSDPHPRYVLSGDGFDVYDRWYCFERVYATQRIPYRTSDSISMQVLGDFPAQRAFAYRALNHLNAAHDAWLAEGEDAPNGRMV